MDKPKLYVSNERYVYFDDTGNLIRISNKDNIEGNYITVQLDDVMSMITGAEGMEKYVVLFDTVTKQNVLRSRYIEEEIQFDINSQIYQLPTIKPNRPDFTIQQDIPNKVWRLILDETLQYNLKQKSLKFTSALNISITKKNDPHHLHNSFVIDLSELDENGFEVPFTSQIELDANALSVYTTKRLETYYHEVLQ